MSEIVRVVGKELLVGEGLKACIKLLTGVAKAGWPCLLRAETGTGKELLARLYHELSGRRAGPFVPVDLNAIARPLVEDELFGHERHAYTGAGAGRAGRFEAAAGGTVFLDEVGDQDLVTQAKLMRVITELAFSRLGESRLRPVECGLVFATNRDLEDAERRGKLRKDFYFRMAKAQVWIPSLRDRAADIPELASYLTVRISKEAGLSPVCLGDQAMHVLMRYPWPGNVRELENEIRRLTLAHAGEQVGAEDLELGRRRGTARRTKAERNAALADAKGVVANAARKLGISRASWYRQRNSQEGPKSCETP